MITRSDKSKIITKNNSRENRSNDDVKEMVRLILDKVNNLEMKLNTIETDISILKNTNSCHDKEEKIESKPQRQGKYKHPIEILNSMNLTYEKLLTGAEMCIRRLNRKYTVAELQESDYIGVFARQTLSAELKKIFESIYPNSKWRIISNFQKGVDLAWKCHVKNCDFRLKHKFNFNEPYLVFKANSILHTSHSIESI